MLKTCSKCQSHKVADRTANLCFALTAVLAVISVFLIFISWPWGFLSIAAMLTCIVLAVDLPARKYRCKNCGHEWKEGYNPSGDVPTSTV